ncbi:MAG: Heavy metal transport/detoxification protein [Parcubacteria group bacterium Athens0714_25]|nr:MAG: Heavy metal transport/detoxification protein [Parcubacteria group bacterium Athens0714_25]
MQTIKVVNIKCSGCAAQIKKSLESSGISNVNVDIANQEVSFEGNLNEAKNKLEKIGYPAAESRQAKSLLKKAQSYVSCMIGKTSEKK